jgi:CRISPR-associated protein Cas5t
MSAISLRVSVPVCSFRRPYSREFLESERIPPPSTVYGFILSLVGEENRYSYIGTEVAIAITRTPSVSLVLRTVWRVKNRKAPPGIGENRRPDYQEILTDLQIAVWVADGPLANRLERAAKDPTSVSRYGGLSLGESRDLVDEVCFNPVWNGSTGRWLTRDNEGNYPLPVWVDHVGSKGTNWQQFRIVERPLTEPPRVDPRWILIEPPRV